MTQRFHFDLTDGKATLPDRAGVLAGDLREAIEEAHEALREMRASEELDEFGEGWKLVIRDESGGVRKTFSIW
jgi:hypothetical protein